MKRLFLATVLALVFASSSFASNGKNNSRILSKVNAQFVGATDIEIFTKANFIKASFVQNGEKIQAFYEMSGEFIATAKPMDIAKLPTNAKRLFAKKYADYMVTEAIVFEGTEEVSYYISAKKDNQNVVLKVSEGGMVDVFKKMKD